MNDIASSFHRLKQRFHFYNSLQPKRAAIFRWLAYLIFTVIFAGILIFYKFPYDSLENRLGAAVVERWGLKLDVADLRPSLPPKLNFSGFTAQSLGYEGQLIFQTADGVIRPRILPLFVGRFTVTIRANVDGGFLVGDVILKPFWDVRNYSLKANWQAIRLERQPGLFLLLERKLSGMLSGDIQLVGLLEELTNSSGRGQFRLTEGSCPIEHPYLKLKTLEDLEVNAVFRLDGGQLEIDDFRFQAQGIQGNLDGTLQFAARLYESVLDLGGQCQIASSILNLNSGSNRGLLALLGNGKPLPFRLRGTLAQPRLNLF